MGVPERGRNRSFTRRSVGLMPHLYRFWRVVVATALAATTIGAAVSSSSGVAPAHTHATAGHHHAPSVGGPSGQDTRALARYLGPTKPNSGPTQGTVCDDGSMPEKVQGKVPKVDYDSGRAAKGYFCNARLISHFGTSGGYRVERYVDKAGNECAYWDSTLLWPHNMPEQGAGGPGVYVMDMSDPANPVHTDTLTNSGDAVSARVGATQHETRPARGSHGLPDVASRVRRRLRRD